MPPQPAPRRLLGDEDRRRRGRGRQRRDQHVRLPRGGRVAPLDAAARPGLRDADVARRTPRAGLRGRDAAALRRHRVVAGVGRRRAGARSTARRCWPARRASTSRCAPAWRSPSWWTTRSRSGSSRAAGSATRCASTATCSWTSRTFSMDWYYPVLGGAVRGQAGLDLIATRWDDFVMPGLGIRCVDANPWVTGAETCELVMALDCLDDHERALRLFADMQHLRHENGSYWTGSVHPEDVFWPGEQTTYTAAAVILAADELSRTSPGLGDHARRDAGRALPGDRAGVRLPERTENEDGEDGDRSSADVLSRPLLTVRVSTRIDPTVPAGSKAPLATARCQTWNGAWPPSSGRSNTSWITSTPPGCTQWAKPRVVVLRVLLGVAAVDEQQRERRAPVARRRWWSARRRATTSSSSPATRDRAAEHRQRVHHAQLRVDQAGVVVLPAGLVLLRAAVVVEGEHHAAGRPRRGAEVDRGLAAVGADLERRARRRGGPRRWRAGTRPRPRA